MRDHGLEKPVATSPWHPGPGSQARGKPWATAGLTSGWVLLRAGSYRGSDWPPRCLPHQSLSLLSCCQLPLSFYDCMSGRRSQAPSQPPIVMEPSPTAPSCGQWKGPCPVACPHYCTDSYGLMRLHAAPRGSQHALLHANGHISSLIHPCTPWCPWVGGTRLSTNPL